MIEYQRRDAGCLALYDRIPMCLQVRSIYRLEVLNRGLGGIRFVETPVEPYLKDFSADAQERAENWAQRFDICNWAFFFALDGERPVGAAAVALRTPGVHMLEGREDLAVLWDIRVREDYKRQGIGQGLFDRAAAFAREQGCSQLKIECQNNNVPAIRFYHRQGAVLGALDTHAYYSEPQYRDEVQLIWYLDL